MHIVNVSCVLVQSIKVNDSGVSFFIPHPWSNSVDIISLMPVSIAISVMMRILHDPCTRSSKRKMDYLIMLQHREYLSNYKQ